ncbi:junctophilin-like protein [Perilla frutescens var. hirtella]|nr:junctophilin-like protein [Perilla frutescens var. hirtella]
MTEKALFGFYAGNESIIATLTNQTVVDLEILFAMATNTNAPPLLLPEIGPDGLLRESPVIAYTEKIIEAEQLQLRKYIEENYSKIRDIERELANLTLEMKLTSGPKKVALELMRKKIEMSTERIHVAKLKEGEAKKAWEAAAKAVQEEEAIKDKLCGDLNNLVKESSNAQLSRLEELKRRLEALNPSRSSTYISSEENQRLATTQDSPAAPTISEQAGNITEGSATNSSMKDQNQPPAVEAEGRGKKKSAIYGKVRGIGAVPKGRGLAAAGWTGAGFDVDGRG